MRSYQSPTYQVILGIVSALCAVHATHAQPCTQYQVTKLVAFDGETFDKFGHGSAISDPWFFMGADGRSEAGEFANSGAVYVYLRTGEETWTFREKLFAPDAFGGENFGRSIDTNGTHLVVGAMDANASCGDSTCISGAAYVFYLADQGTPDPLDDVWLAQDKLVPTVPLHGLKFGLNSAIHGDWVVVGGGITSCEPGSGSAYIYHRDDGGTPDDPTDDTWPLHAELTSPGAAENPNDHFGWDVDIWENRVVVGAKGWCPAEEEEFTGLAYAFRRDDAGTPGDVTDDTWVHESRLSPLSHQGDQQFGAAVSIRGDVIAVGAQDDNTFAFTAGSVYAFRLDDGGTPADETDDSWALEEQLFTEIAGVAADLGVDVEISGNRIMAGAWRHTVDPQLMSEGGGFTFRYAGGVWHDEQRLLSDVRDSTAQVCERVAHQGEWVVCSEDQDDTAAEDAGAAYIFKVQNDCDGDCTSDEDELAAGATDCNANGLPDVCEPDCNTNGVADACDIAAGTSEDCNANGVPDECDRDCNADGLPDDCATACTEVCECNDFDACTLDDCVEGACTHTPRPYGDVTGNGLVNLFDIFGMLDAIAGENGGSAMHLYDIQPCPGDDEVNLSDVFAVLDAIGGKDPCFCGS